MDQSISDRTGFERGRHEHRCMSSSKTETIRRRAGAGFVALSTALARKHPNAPREWPWQWVFPRLNSYKDSETGERHRHPLHETVLQRAFRRAVVAAGINKSATCYITPLFCNASTPSRVRHSNHSRVIGLLRRLLHDGLHSRVQPWPVKVSVPMG